MDLIAIQVPELQTGVEHLVDVRMVHHRQRLALSLEARDALFGVHPQLDNFQGHPSFDGLFLLRHIHVTNPSFTYGLKNLVASNQRARRLLLGNNERFIAVNASRVVSKASSGGRPRGLLSHSASGTSRRPKLTRNVSIFLTVSVKNRFSLRPKLKNPCPWPS